MQKRHLWPALIVVLGILVILIPWVLFPVCGVGRYAPPSGVMGRMHGCDGTLKAATILGALMVFMGLLPLIIQKHQALVAALAATLCTGVLLILFPTLITGVCKVPTMPCVFGAKPALIIAGIISILVGGGGLLATRSRA